MTPKAAEDRKAPPLGPWQRAQPSIHPCGPRTGREAVSVALSRSRCCCVRSPETPGLSPAEHERARESHEALAPPWQPFLSLYTNPAALVAFPWTAVASHYRPSSPLCHCGPLSAHWPCSVWPSHSLSGPLTLLASSLPQFVQTASSSSPLPPLLHFLAQLPPCTRRRPDCPPPPVSLLSPLAHTRSHAR